MVLRRILSPSLETGAVFRCCTVGELLQDCDLVSVIAVQEKCDEKGLGAASGHRSVRCRQFGRAPLRLSPSASLGASAKQGRLSRKAREGAPPQLFLVNTQRHPRYSSSVKWPTQYCLGQPPANASCPPYGIWSLSVDT